MDEDVPIPIRVTIVDDDYSALKNNASLLLKDIRTTINAEFQSIPSFLAWLKKYGRQADVVLLDVEYRPDSPPLASLIRQIKTIRPGLVVVCLSQYGEAEVVKEAVAAGADGFLLKDDVKLAMATAVTRAYAGQFVYSPGVQANLERALGHSLAGEGRLERWQLHPELTPRLKQIFWLCFIDGLSAPEAADELGITETAVERYRTQIIRILADEWWHDRSELGGLEDRMVREQWSETKQRFIVIRGQVWAFHILTQPPQRDALEWFGFHKDSKKQRQNNPIRFL